MADAKGPAGQKPVPHKPQQKPQQKPQPQKPQQQKPQPQKPQSPKPQQQKPQPQKPQQQKPQPKKPSPFPDDAFAAAPASGMASTAAFTPTPGKHKKASWLKQNGVLVTGLSVAFVLLVLVIFLMLPSGSPQRVAGPTPKGGAVKQPGAKTAAKDAKQRKAATASSASPDKASPGATATPGAAAGTSPAGPAISASSGAPGATPAGSAPTMAPGPALSGAAGPTFGPAPSGVQDPSKPQTPPLTDDFKKWKRPDWTRARRENHPKLLEGVAYLGGKFPDMNKTAEGLADLLKPLPPAKDSPSGAATPSLGGAPTMGPALGGFAGPGMTPGTSTGLVDGIITSLGNNGSPVAWKTIREVLAGAFATDDDRAAIDSAVKALLAHPSADNDALVTNVLVAPETVRTTTPQGACTATEMHTKAFEIVKLSQSSGLRTRLAKAVIEHGGLNAEDSVHKFLLDESPLNCGAQVLLYPRAKGDLKGRLERQLIGYSSLALARYLGIPDGFQPGVGGGVGPAVGMAGPGPGPGPGPGIVLPGPGIAPAPPGAASPSAQAPKPADAAELAGEMARQLWTPEFRALFESELGKASLEKQAQLLSLASTIPQDAPRTVLNKALARRLNAKTADEPTPLETAGLIDKVVTDPALLVSIKLLRREAGFGRTSSRANVDKSKAEKWTAFTQKMVESWCKRFAAAAQAKEDKKEGNGDATPSLPTGWKLGADATVKASHHLAWPEQAPPELAKLNPGFLSIHYLRIEENGKPKRVTDHYTRQAGANKADVRPVGSNTWIDKVDKDRRRSVDVWITNPQGTPVGSAAPAIGPGASRAERPKPEAEVDLVIEVLVIETKEPAK
ncbi:MAG: hypothetical protein ABFC96_04560 [Thermoguttaceae bacterium]